MKNPRDKNRMQVAGRQQDEWSADQVDFVDMLTTLSKFRQGVLERVAKDIKNGMTAKEVNEKYFDDIRLRQTLIALAEPDSAKALAAIKDLVDRKEGRPKENKEITHRLEKLPDEQLDSLILSELSSSGVTPEDPDRLN